MTNTNDFRKYSYQYDTSYLISGFNATRSSVAPKPKYTPDTDEKTFTLHENEKVKTSSQIIKEEKQGLKKAVAMITVAACIMSILALTVYSFALKNELTREVYATQVKISNAQSENISLQSQLDAMVSISMIDEYAVEKLHMTKMKSGQMQYMDVNQYKQVRGEQIANSSPKDNPKQVGNN